MKTRYIVAMVAAQLVLGTTVAFGAAAQSRSDIVLPLKRQATVELAERLTKPPTPAPVPAELKHPFNPPDFNQPDPNDPQASAPKAAPATPGAPAQPAGPASDREVLEALAMRIPSTGTLGRPDGTTLLVVGRNRLRVGDVFTVTYNNHDYDLELVAIDRTTFTLRYRNEETTRPIKSK